MHALGRHSVGARSANAMANRAGSRAGNPWRTAISRGGFPRPSGPDAAPAQEYTMPQAIDITGPISALGADGARVLTKEALAFVGELEARFAPVRASLLERRRKRDAEIAAGASYGLLAESAAVRSAD